MRNGGRKPQALCTTSMPSLETVSDMEGSACQHDSMIQHGNTSRTPEDLPSLQATVRRHTHTCGCQQRSATQAKTPTQPSVLFGAQWLGPSLWNCLNLLYHHRLRIPAQGARLLAGMMAVLGEVMRRQGLSHLRFHGFRQGTCFPTWFWRVF